MDKQLREMNKETYIIIRDCSRNLSSPKETIQGVEDSTEKRLTRRATWSKEVEWGTGVCLVSQSDGTYRLRTRVRI